MKNPKAILAAWSLLLIGLLALFLHQHALLMFEGADGQYMREEIRESVEWKSPAFWFHETPMQSAGGLEFQQKMRTTIIYGLPILLLGNAPPLVVYLVAAGLLLGALYLLARALDAPRWGAFAGAWAAIILSFPTSKQQGFYPLFFLVPNNIEVHALVILSAALLILAMRRKNLFFGVLAAGGLLDLALTNPMGSSLRVAVVGLTILPVLVTLLRDSVNRWALAALAICAAVQVAVTPYILGFFLNTPSFLMKQDLESVGDLTDLSSVSIFFNSGYKLGRIALALGVFLAVVYLFRGKSLWLRRWAAGVLGVHGLILVAGFASVHNWFRYTGPYFIYFELPLSLFYCVIGGSLCEEALAWPGWRERIKPFYVHAFCAGLLALFAVRTLFDISDADRKSLLVFADMQSNPLVDYLQKEIALHPGDPFRGYEASFFGYDDADGGVDWPALHAQQGILSGAIHNDLRMLGLWKFSIPTLFYDFQSENPWLFYVNKRLLARPQDRQRRDAPVQSRPDVPLLASLGVRFVIASSSENMPGCEKIMSMETLPGKPLTLFELPQPNVAGYSPTTVVTPVKPSEAVKLMGSPDFDFHKTAVILSDEEMPREGFNLHPAKTSALVWDTDGLHVTTTSDGQCLLVLPMIYSSVLEVYPAGSARLIRVNLCQTGLLFDRQAEVRVTARYGAFTNPFSLLREFQQTRARLKLDQPAP